MGGTLVVCTETTSRVIAQRRLRISRDLAEKTNFAPNVEAVLDCARDLLAGVPADVVCALVYIKTEDGTPVLKRSVGVDDDARAVLDAAFREELPRLHRLGVPVPVPAGLTLVGSAWPEPVSQVFVAPIAIGGTRESSG